jgi:hypothetical protein
VKRKLRRCDVWLQRLPATQYEQLWLGVTTVFQVTRLQCTIDGGLVEGRCLVDPKTRFASLQMLKQFLEAATGDDVEVSEAVGVGRIRASG